jgi:uncharacterized protein (DUF2147 family)
MTRILCAFALLMAVWLPAAGQSPAGVWKTVDDKTGRDKSLVVIREEGGKIFGRIEKLLDSSDPNKKCIKCDGALKNKPMVGIQVFGPLQKDGDQWTGGKILDPDNGKYYRCYLTLEEGGKKLKVRGYIGISLLGRTQYWLREK